MYSNPYQIFGISEDMKPYELRQALLDYKIRAVAFNQLYTAYMHKVGPVAMHTTNQSEIVEQLLSKRYEFGLEFEQIPLGENEIGDFLNRVSLYRKKVSGNNELSTITEEDVKKRIEMFGMSMWYVGEIKSKAEKAIDAFDENPENVSPMMDALLSIRYGELKIDIAKELAARASSYGLILDEQSFWDLMISSAPYEQIKKIYEQVSTKEKRDELIPELYVRKKMSNPNEVMVIGEDTIQHLLDREHKYTVEYFEDLTARLEGKRDRREPALENQNHDYAWGMVLESPKVLIDNEQVDTPIFKGKIKVERLGSFTEKSLFSRSKYIRETEIETRKRVKAPEKKGLLSSLTMKRSDKKDTSVPQTMREQFYLHEARKTLHDNVWRVTKTGLDGKTASYIIFTPLEYLGNIGSDLREFIKSVYLSDYMLNIAVQNGGYAGRIHRDDGGFLISTKYSQEEIASAVLFRNGQRGDIYDCRDSKNKVKLNEKTFNDFLSLINSKNRGERVKDE